MSLLNLTRTMSFTKIGILGAGQMGGGIARVSLPKYKTVLVDANQKMLDKFKSKYDHENLTLSTDIKSFKDCDLVVEAVPEVLELKRKLLQQVFDVAPKAVICTNTSSLDVKKCFPSGKEALGLHFFNPVTKMPLVEIIYTASNQEKKVAQLKEYCKNIEKAPVICKNTPGFIVNRLLVPYILEAIKLVERGDASMSDVDKAMKLGAGYPMGPFTLADFVGLDTLLFISEGWYKENQQEWCKPPKTLIDLVNEKKLGLKTKAGFFLYDEAGKKMK
eukprot:NODE_15_length_50561_cov_0.608081.p23 type:complete len:275 gc:universal NODE_15_length_50561_cov_0.608081:6268-5444(-)